MEDQRVDGPGHRVLVWELGDLVQFVALLHASCVTLG